MVSVISYNHKYVQQLYNKMLTNILNKTIANRGIDSQTNKTIFCVIRAYY